MCPARQQKKLAHYKHARRVASDTEGQAETRESVSSVIGIERVDGSFVLLAVDGTGVCYPSCTGGRTCCGGTGSIDFA